MNKGGQLGLAITLGIIALVLGLLFALPIILPDSVKAMLENYKAEKLNAQIKSERIAALRGLPAVTVIGDLTCLDSNKMLIHTTLRNVGGDYAVNPAVRDIIVKDLEPGITRWLTVGRPIPGGVWKDSLAPKGKIKFTINITEPAVKELLIEDPRYRLQLDINVIYYSKSGHQFEETETVIVTPSPDFDKDNYSECEGDCDDNDPNVYPGAPEILDGKDSDCDGIMPLNESDSDLDGYMIGQGDCNDTDPNVYPGAEEICDGKDSNCDGFIPLNETTDADLDGYILCLDCNDNNASINPGAAEICNGVDDNCNNLIDEGVTIRFYYDADNDTYGTASYQDLCEASGNYRALNTGDCDDSDATIYPGAPELCDGKDNDCDNITPSNETDADLDGYMICEGDCNDTNPFINPGAEEVCDGIDNNCDGLIDQKICGTGTCEGVQTCIDSGWSNCSTYGKDAGVCAICNESGYAVYDGTQDNDCLATICPADVCGGDGCGPYIWCDYPDNVTNYCSAIYTCTSYSCDAYATCEADNDLDGYSVSCGDCNDTNANINPAATEVCNGVDDNCDGTIDEGCYFYFDIAAGTDAPSVDVFLAIGNGSFVTPPTLLGAAGTVVYGVAIGELNNDNNLDIAAGIEDGPAIKGIVEVYFGYGNGSFESGVTYIASDIVFSIDIGDLNNDSDIDVVSGNKMKMDVFMNNGTGGFSTPTTYATNGDVKGIVTEDLDSDNDLDIVTGEYSINNNIEIFFNNGSGYFGTPSAYSALKRVRDIKVGDLDNDNDADIVIGTNEPDIEIFFNDGTGYFGTGGPALTYSTSAIVNAVALGDLNNDGYLDIVGGKENGEMEIWFNDGTGSFGGATSVYISNAKINTVAIGDLEMDNDADIVIGTDAPDVEVYLNDGTGSFSLPTAYPTNGNVLSIALGSVDGATQPLS